ncbi:MAG TPA: hypothetical protein VIH99_13680 [Bdellovibrionota bacterium]|jgi:hypothetical protein
MKRAILGALLALFSLLSNPNEARANAYTCQMTGGISGLKLGFVVGGQVLDGEGVIRCQANRPGLSDAEIPVLFTVVGGGLAFDFTIVRAVNLVTAGIGVFRDPRDLLGQYSVAATAGATLIHRGYNVQSAISVKHRAHGIGFDLGFQGEYAVGLGARLHGLVLLIRPLY